jgi:catechol 1,2-dioxygenase
VSGDPLPGAVLDIWHADASGTYSNESPDLPAWHLRGRQRIDASGAYRVHTVEPRHYTVKDDGPVGSLLAALGRHPWRPAHIHYLVTAEGYEPLVTQIYLAGGPYLDDDAIDDVKDELIRPIDDGTLTFDIALMPVAPASRTEDDTSARAG